MRRWQRESMQPQRAARPDQAQEKAQRLAPARTPATTRASWPETRMRRCARMRTRGWRRPRRRSARRRRCRRERGWRRAAAAQWIVAAVSTLQPQARCSRWFSQLRLERRRSAIWAAAAHWVHRPLRWSSSVLHGCCVRAQRKASSMTGSMRAGAWPGACAGLSGDSTERERRNEPRSSEAEPSSSAPLAGTVCSKDSPVLMAARESVGAE